MIRKIFLTSLLLMGCLVVATSGIQPVRAERGDQISTEHLSSQMDAFASRGAKGFLIWQYSGDLYTQDGYFANDQYSFFRNIPSGVKVCQLLKEKSGLFEFVGVNMHDVGSNSYSQQMLEDHFAWLHNECGVSVVRTFAKSGEAPGMMKALEAAKNTNIKLIIALGDYSNGGGGIPAAAPISWYRPGNYANYFNFAKTIAEAVSGHPSLYGLELANEPHCGSESANAQEDIGIYANWGKDVGEMLSAYSHRVGYGQMANPHGICDGPFHGFRETNSISQINMTSAHYYDQAEYEASLAALDISNNLNKMFYVGEASWLGEEGYTTKNPSEYMMVPLILQPEKYAGGEKDIVHELLWNMVVDQGYEVSCASPELYVNAFKVGKLLDYFSENNTSLHPGTNYDEIELELTGSGNHQINLSRAIIPMYRGSESSEITTKTSSFEGYFGVLNLEYDPDKPPEVQSGVANNLLSSSLQCQIKLDNLYAARDLCEKLVDSNQCVLHRQIANSPYYLYSTHYQHGSGERSLLTSLEDIWSKYPDHDLSCKKLMAMSYDTALPTEITNELAEIRNALDETPLDLDNVYRYAFAVLSPMQNVDMECGAQIPDNFWYLHHSENETTFDICMKEKYGDNYLNIQKRVPLIIAFKIPLTATNTISSLSLHNSASITASTISSLESQENKSETIGRISRQELLNQVLDTKSNLWDAKGASQNDVESLRARLTINCQGMPVCDGAHGAGVELTQALVHIINGSKTPCNVDSFGTTTLAEDGSNYLNILYDKDNPLPHSAAEKADELGSGAKHDFPEPPNPQSPEKTFLQEYYNVAKSSAEKNRWNWRLVLDKHAAQKVDNDEAVIPGKYERGDKVVDESVLVHIVAPIGTELTFIESRLAALFSQEQLLTMIEQNQLVDGEKRQGDIPRYFSIPDIDFGYDSKGEKEYRHKECPYKINPLTNKEDPLLGRQRCMIAGVKLTDQNVGLYYKGAKLGWFIRKIQEAITSSFGKAHSYVTTCKRVEDLFLGKCGESTQGSSEFSDSGTSGGSGSAPSSENMDCPIETLQYDTGLVNAVGANKEKYLAEFVGRSFCTGQGSSCGTTYMNSSLFEYTIRESEKYNVNPALVLALGREETAWGAVGNQAAAGCLGTDYQDKKVSEVVSGLEYNSNEYAQAVISHQTQCIAKNFSDKSPMSCKDFMCRYSGDKMSAPCVFNNNPNFPNNLPKFYRSLTD